MGVAEELKGMVDRHELEGIGRDIERADAILAGAERSLTTARAIVNSDPDNALLLAWNAIAFQALTATLLLAGYRVTSQVGHHRVAVNAGRLLLNEDALLSRVRGLMRARSRGMYENEPAEKEEVIAGLDDCEKLIKLVRSKADRARGVK
jgi:hypothetical protein